MFAVRYTVAEFIFRNALFLSIAGTLSSSSGTLACRNIISKSITLCRGRMQAGLVGSSYRPELQACDRQMRDHHCGTRGHAPGKILKIILKWSKRERNIKVIFVYKRVAVSHSSWICLCFLLSSCSLQKKHSACFTGTSVEKNTAQNRLDPVGDR